MNYISGTYNLKYYHQLVNTRGETVRLEVYQKGSLPSGYPRQIGDIRDLQLNVLGGTADVFTPIIKTELTFNMVDTWDVPSGTTANSTKHGSWEEFYTPDSTGYLVKVLTKAPGASGSSAFVPRWSGYITPDSWREYLEYHGLVTITCRDNIGHLQDFDFDLAGDDSGTASIREMITAAMELINMPMNLVLHDEDALFVERLVTTGTLAGPLDLRFNVARFEGQTWYEALSDVLDAIGYVLRYQDGDAIGIGPLRYLSRGAGEEAFGQCAIKFLNGTRTLNPAYKDITEVVEFDPQESVQEDPTAGVSFVRGDYVRYSCYMKKQNGTSLASTSGRAYTIQAGGPRWDGTQTERTAFLDTSKYVMSDDALSEEGDGYKAALFIASNEGGATTSLSIHPVWHHYMSRAAGKIKLKFKPSPGCLDAQGKLGIGNAVLYRVLVQLGFKNSQGQTYYYHPNGRWNHDSPAYYPPTIVEEGANEVEFSFTGDPVRATNGVLSLKIMEIEYRCTGDSYNGIGCYARLEAVEILPLEADRSLVSDSVHTLNNANYNVRCRRTPRLGFLSTEKNPALPGFYAAAFFCQAATGGLIPAPYNWKWTSESAYIPFPVQIHKQILCFFHETSEVLEGDCLPVADNVSGAFGKLLVYNNKNHVILGGSLNFMTGRFQALRMQTYVDWDTLWGNTPVESTLEVTPDFIDLTNAPSGTIRIDSNTDWELKYPLATGVSMSPNSGSGPALAVVSMGSSVYGQKDIILHTTDDEVIKSITIIKAREEVSMESVGEDLEDMDFAGATSRYAVEINFDGQTDNQLFLEFPSWIHFVDSDADGGIVYTPGTYYLYHDNAPAGSLPREGYIQAMGSNSQQVALIHVKQTGN